MAVLSDLRVGEAAVAIRDGAITSEALAEALLARAKAHVILNAFTALEADAVREAAREADRRRAGGIALGALHGVPLAIKDNFDTVSLPTAGGTPALKAHRPKHNAAVVQKLLDAGAIMLGKANMHELAFGITNNNACCGAARKPYDPERIPGGSSGGTAVAVAARLAPGGLGTDTGGSVRVPAALCGVVGFRPTTGRWPQMGIVPISHTRDTAGPLTRAVADCVLMDGVVTGGPLEVAPAAVKGLRLGVPRGHFWENLDTEVAAIVEQRLDEIRDAGAILIERDIPDLAALEEAAGFPIALYEVVEDLGAYLASHDLGLAFADVAAKVASPDVRSILLGLTGAGAIPEPVYRDAIGKYRPGLKETIRRYFHDRDVAAIAFPTTPAPAAKIGEDETFELNGAAAPTFLTFVRNSGPGSVAGIPGLSLPAGLTAAGLPVGLEIDGPEGADLPLLAIGRALEAVLPSLPPPRL